MKLLLVLTALFIHGVDAHLCGSGPDGGGKKKDGETKEETLA